MPIYPDDIMDEDYNPTSFGGSDAVRRVRSTPSRPSRPTRPGRRP